MEENKEVLLRKLIKIRKISYKKYRKLLSKFPSNENRVFSKSEILEVYHKLLEKDKIKKSIEAEEFLKKKPTRTISGVAPVTVLTKPYDCPGDCIFCPTRQDQPKSYLSSEPGAMRAKMLAFDPYRQVSVRIQALKNIGHNVDKIELIILGGTWSHYNKKYQLWFIKECFRAMNDFDNDEDDAKQIKVDIEDTLNTLKKAILYEQKRNESTNCRNVGLVIETRPDSITEKEVKWIRYLGATKVQLGVQTLDKRLLRMNNRGHTLSDTRKAIKLLRLAGFKLHLHWMLNLYGSDPKNDYMDFNKLFEEKYYMPDELKLYPCILLKGTKLFELYKKTKYRPYNKEELLKLLIKCKLKVPNYCRISRLFRDIPSFEIEDGVKESNFRQIVQEEMDKRGLSCKCIRCREIRSSKTDMNNLKMKTQKYETSVGTEYFISYITRDNKIAGFLRLSVPKVKNFISEIQDSTMIREVHIYGVSQKLKSRNDQRVQHQGLGSSLISKAEDISKKNGFKKVSVISALGTRLYYLKLGYDLGKLYMQKKLV